MEVAPKKKKKVLPKIKGENLRLGADYDRLGDGLTVQPSKMAYRGRYEG